MIDRAGMLRTTEEIQALFVEELGWDLASGAHHVSLLAPGQVRRGWLTRDERELRARLRHHRFLLQPVVRKQASTLFVCTCSSLDDLPVFNYRLRLHYRCRDWSPSPIVYYPAPDGLSGLWQWAERPEDGELPFERRTEGADEWAEWREMLDRLAFSMDDETRGVTASEVARRLKAVFWIDRPKRRYLYEAFDPERYRSFGEGLYRLALFADAQDWPDWEEERTLGRLAQEGREWARRRLLDAQLRAALEHARKVDPKRYTKGMEMEDLVSASLQGLHTAVERYDPSRDVRLQSYASIWMRKAIDRTIETQARIVDLPVHAFAGIEQGTKVYDRLWDAMAQATHRIPEETEVVRSLNLGPSETFAWPLYGQIHGNIFDFNEDTLPPPLIAEPEDPEENPRLDSILQDVERLPAREAAVIRWRFLSESGPGSGRLTLDEVAAKVGVTRERARQIEMRALKRLRGEKPMGLYAREKAAS